MARRMNSMQLRRRQSDAKWRASVANCYNTLNMITTVSSNKNKAKKPCSKAYILQKTVNYISHLESTLSAFLDEKCKMIQNGSLPNISHTILMIEQVRQEFFNKQIEIFANGLTMKKCSSGLDDLLNKAFEINSTALSTPETQLNETPVFESIYSEESKNEFLENYQKPKKWKLEIENDSTEVLSSMFSPNTQRQPDYTFDNDFSSTSLPLSSPLLLSSQSSSSSSSTASSSTASSSTASSASSAVCKFKEWSLGFSVNQFSRDSFKTEIKIEKNLFETPKKQTEISEKKSKENQSSSESCLLSRPLQEGNSLFTPLKSPPVVDLDISPIDTPYRMQLSNYLPSSFLYSTPENEQEKTFTFQSIDAPDSVTPSSQSLKTHSNKTDKRGTTCRKRLDKHFTESKSKQDVSFDLGVHEIVNDDSLDFDGYFLFYKQFVEEVKHQSPNKETVENIDLAGKVSKMWSTLPTEEKNMLIAMAASEKKKSQDLKLTDYLRKIDVQKVFDIDDIDDAHLFNTNDDEISQVVPNKYPAASATCSSSDFGATDPSFSQYIVPDIDSNTTSNPDQYFWTDSGPSINLTFQMDSAGGISYEINNMATAENMEFDVSTIKSECDDKPMETIWNDIEIHPGKSFQA